MDEGVFKEQNTLLEEKVNTKFMKTRAGKRLRDVGRIY